MWKRQFQASFLRNVLWKKASRLPSGLLLPRRSSRARDVFWVQDLRKTQAGAKFIDPKLSVQAYLLNFTYSHKQWSYTWYQPRCFKIPTAAPRWKRHVTTKVRLFLKLWVQFASLFCTFDVFDLFLMCFFGFQLLGKAAKLVRHGSQALWSCPSELSGSSGWDQRGEKMHNDMLSGKPW